jgi:phospholipid-binding lipoprotein MlaA
LLSLDRLLDGALDRYQFIRDAYLQRRRNQVYDGNPPRVKDEEDE